MRLRASVPLLVLGLVVPVLGEDAPTVGPPPPTQDVRPSLLSNGDFSKLDEKNWPADWPRKDGVTFEKEGDIPFLRLQSSQPDQMILVYRRVDLPSPAPAALEIRLRLRYADVKSGKKEWNDARIMGHFKNQAGRELKPALPVPSFRGSSKSWIEHTYFAKVPVSATYVELMPSLFQPASGTLDLAQCLVLPATKEQMAAAGPKIVPSETIVPAQGAPIPPELRVAGNQLQTPDGKAVWLQGLCVDSLEWSAGGERVQQSVVVAMEQWKSNVIRLPVADKFWFGQGPYQKRDGGVGYRKIVDAVIEAAASRGAYVAVDLHSFGAPMEEHVTFWQDVATRYKNHPAVLFELFNEAHGISWKMWRDGGNLEDPGSKRQDVNAAENKLDLTGETSPGMQGLLDAVRGTGAKNIVIVGGLDWGYDLSGVVKDYALQERAGGNGIMYSSHIYPWKSNWQGNTLAAAEKYPVFVGEVGCPPDYSGFQFIPPSGRHPLEGWAEDMLALIQKHKLNWTGFSFHPGCGPKVISDWNYTPTPYWGVFVKDALAGKQFELKKMR